MTGAGSTELVLASTNPDKSAEIQAILGSAGSSCCPAPPTPPTSRRPARPCSRTPRLKATALSAVTGRPAVADDTGLSVVALGGAPGVYSARYAGEGATYADNVAKLLDELGRLPSGDRRARFVSVALVAFPDGSEVFAEGAVDGTIATEPRGTRGFGYDPVFIPDEGDGRTFAEMSGDEKHAFSHRGRAFRALAARLVARSTLTGAGQRRNPRADPSQRAPPGGQWSRRRATRPGSLDEGGLPMTSSHEEGPPPDRPRSAG